MAITVPRTASALADASASASVSFASLPAAGSLIVVGVNIGDHTTDTLTCADNQGGSSYSGPVTIEFVSGSEHERAAIFYRPNISAPSGTFTATVSGGVAATSYWTIGILEAVGADTSAPLDVQATNGASSGSNPLHCTSGTTAATAQADELAVAVLCLDGWGAAGIATPSGYTSVALSDDGSAHLTGSIDYKILSATGTQSADWGSSINPQGSPGNWAAVIATFKAAAGSATTVNATTAAGSWAGQTAAIALSTAVAASLAAGAWAGLSASVSIGVSVAATAAAGTWAGLASSIALSTNVASAQASGTWAGLSATITLGTPTTFATGSALLDFGTGLTNTSTSVSGQPGIKADAKAEAYVMADDTTVDHTAVDHRVFASLVGLTCGALVADQGMTIYAYATQPLSGRYAVRWVWVD